MSSEERPAGVSETKQAGEATGRWAWVERAVWTDRMLEALETGVKGGVSAEVWIINAGPMPISTSEGCSP